MTTTASSFVSELAAAPEAPVVFDIEGRPIRPEYHVTEVKLAHVRAVDCGRGESEWDETLVQLLDGPATSVSGSHLSASKISDIINTGRNALHTPDQAELYFEFSRAHAALRKLAVHSIEYQDDGWLVRLAAVSAVCKPALRHVTENPNADPGCCGVEKAESGAERSCCAPATEDNACGPNLRVA